MPYHAIFTGPIEKAVGSMLRLIPNPGNLILFMFLANYITFKIFNDDLFHISLHINNVEDQLDATIKKIIDVPISSTCFGQFFAHPQERKTVFYSAWYNAPKLLPAGGLERGGTDCVFGMKDVARLSSNN